MRKIPTAFKRDPDDRRYVTDQPAEDCELVFEGLGTARRKVDGTCVMLDEYGQWWARREIKPDKMPPPNYVRVAFDDLTGKAVGWEPIGQSAFVKYHQEALAGGSWNGYGPGTYELVGPKINGNPERRAGHELIRHDQTEVLAITDRSYTELRRILLFLAEKYGCEGVVFHHPDGQRFAKLKARDLRP